MNRSIALLLIAAAAGCAGPRPDTGEADLYKALQGEETVEIADAREMLAAGLRFQIDRYAGKSGTDVEVVFLSILDMDPADRLLARLEGTALEVRKFSEWSAFYRSEDGKPFVPDNYAIISVRSIDIVDYDNAAVSTSWNISGIAMPAETYLLERIAGSWKVTGTRYSSP